MAYLQEKRSTAMRFLLLTGLLLCAPLLLKGQFSFDPDTVRFEKVSPPELDGILKNAMFFDSRGLLWVGTQHGLFAYDGYDWKSGMSQPEDPRIQTDQWVQSITEDSLGSIWFGAQTGGVFQLDPATRAITAYPPKAFSGDPLHNLTGQELTFQNSDMIVQTHRGILRFNPYEKVYKEAYIPFPERADEKVLGYSGAHALNDIHHYLPDEGNSQIWIGTAAGLLLYQVETATTIQCPWPFSNPKSAVGKPVAVMDIHQSGDSLLIGTYGSGFITYKKDLSGWRRDLIEPLEAGHSAGAWSNTIQDFTPLTGSNFLFASSAGCGIYDWSSGGATFFSQGLAPDETYRIVLRDSYGRIWTCSSSGVYRSVFPMLKQNGTSKLVLTQLSVAEGTDYKGYLTGGIEFPKLRDHQNTLEFGYALTQPVHPQAVRYAYHLEGFDREWVDAGNRRFVRYSKLPGGKYNFQVRAVLPDGKTVSTNLFTFEIATPFYRRAWFLFLCFLLLCSTLYFIYRIKLDKVRMQERLQSGFQTEIARMEMQSLRSQMNPHFIFNSLNSIKNYIISKGQGEAAEYVTLFSKLIRVILENSKSELLTLEQELKSLKLYVEVENMRFEKEFHYTISVDPAIHVQSFLLPPMLIQPYVENAIWHGLMHKKENRNLAIHFKKEGDGILCTVTDNGIGRKRAGELAKQRPFRRESMGMRITEHRLQMIKKLYDTEVGVEIQDLHPSDPSYPGTCVRISIQTIKVPHA